jgi:hypothetical protein
LLLPFSDVGISNIDCENADNSAGSDFGTC